MPRVKMQEKGRVEVTLKKEARAIEKEGPPRLMMRNAPLSLPLPPPSVLCYAAVVATKGRERESLHRK